LRTLQLLTLASLLAPFSSPAMADTITLDAFVNPTSYTSDPACSQAGTGTTFASVSFSCIVNGQAFSGDGSAQTGLGPYGIGLEFTIGGYGFGRSGEAETRVLASVFTSGEVAIEGGGSGFIIPVFTLVLAGDGYPIGRINLNFLGDSSFPNGAPLPVTSGTTGVVSISETGECSTFDVSGCGIGEAILTGAIFTDALGNPLTDTTLTLVAVPEASGWPLLAICAIAFASFKRGTIRLA
jgi:hypothetical protein